MQDVKRLILIATVVGLAAPAGAAAQRPSQCVNNLKQIGIGVLNVPQGGPALAAGAHQVAVCAAADGTSSTVMLNEKVLPAQLNNCPANISDLGFVGARATSRERQDGSVEIVVASEAHRGCTATAVLGAAQPGAMLAMQAAPQVRENPARVPQSVRDGFRAFWAELPEREAAALERQLDALEARSQRGEDVDAEIGALQRRYPQLAALSSSIPKGTWSIVGPDGPQPAECIGIGWEGKNGKMRCIGKMKT